jgi:hypothetical protein
LKATNHFQSKLQPMPIKKSAVFSILLALGSVSSLVFTSYRCEQSEKIPGNHTPVKCSRQFNSIKIPLQWNIVSSNIFQMEG